MAIEDFTTYTVHEPDDRVSVTSSAITVTALQRDEEAYVAKDLGVDHFTGDFEHLFDFIFTAHGGGTNDKWSMWAITNELLNSENDHDQSGTSECLNLWGGYDDSPGIKYIQLRNFVNGTIASFATLTGTYELNTQYYGTVQRTDTTVEARVYSDSNRGTLVGSGSLAQSSAYSYQYIHGLLGGEFTGNAYLTGVVSNLDLQEVPPVKPGASSVVPIMQRLGMLQAKRKSILEPFTSRMPKFNPMVVI